MKRHLFIILCILISVVGPVGVVSADKDTSSCSGKEITGSITRTNSDSVRLSLTVQKGCVSDGFKMPEEVHIESMQNLKADSGKYKIVNPAEPAMIEYSIDDSRYYSLHDEWGLVPLPFRGVDVTSVEPEGIVFPTMAFIGEYSTYQNTSAEENITVYVAEPVKDEVDGEKLASVTSRISKDFPTESNGTYRTVVVPNLTKVYGIHTKGVSVVETRPSRSNMYRTIYHEYIHSQQKFKSSLTDDMKWFTEASASYFAMEYSIKHGYLNRGYWNLLVAASDTGGVLTKSSTWESSSTQYIRGALVLKALEQRGVDTEELFLRMNSEKNISYAKFKTLVGKTGGSPKTNEWMNAHIGSGKFIIEPVTFTPVETIIVANTVLYPMKISTMWFNIGLGFLGFVVSSKNYWSRYSRQPRK